MGPTCVFPCSCFSPFLPWVLLLDSLPAGGLSTDRCRGPWEPEKVQAGGILQGIGLPFLPRMINGCTFVLRMRTPGALQSGRPLCCLVSPGPMHVRNPYLCIWCLVGECGWVRGCVRHTPSIQVGCVGVWRLCDWCILSRWRAVLGVYSVYPGCTVVGTAPPV